MRTICLQTDKKQYLGKIPKFLTESALLKDKETLVSEIISDKRSKSSVTSHHHQKSVTVM